LGTAKLLKTNAETSLYPNRGNKMWEIVADKSRQLNLTKQNFARHCAAKDERCAAAAF
jgi:hypothetical protein